MNSEKTPSSNTLLGLLLVAGPWLCACPEKAQAGEDPTGIYRLVSVDGSKLPTKVAHGDVAIQVHSGTFTISVDGTCSSKVIFGRPSGDNITREVKATYTQDGSKLNMQWEGAGSTVGSVDGDSFTMHNEGMIFAYVKETVAAKQNVLDRFIGRWRSTHTLEPDEKGTTDLTYSRVLGGNFVQEQGKVSGENTALVMYAYDAEQNCYRMWRFSSTEEPSEATGKWNPETEILAWTFLSKPGKDFTITASHRFLNDDVFTWDAEGRDSKGKTLFRMVGKATRSK